MQTVEQRIARLGIWRQVRNRSGLADNLLAIAKFHARAQEPDKAWRAMALSEAARWLAAPLNRRDTTGIRAALSDARFWRRHIRMMGRQRHAVLA